MKILAIETSCDETAISIVDASGPLDQPKFEVLADLVRSQTEAHKPHGGVIPNLAKREHSRNLLPVAKQALEEGFGISNFPAHSETSAGKQFPISKEKKEKIEEILEREPELLKQFLEFVPTITKPSLDAIAVTYGPGLEPALWVGVNFARALGVLWDLPVIPANHLEGHIASVLLTPQNHAELTQNNAENQDRFQRESALSQHSSASVMLPAIALIISGGHTELVLVKAWGKYEIIGQTRDDAVGEAFDKVARMLGLPYPGGPQISLLAEQARKSAQTNADLTQNDAQNKEARKNAERTQNDAEKLPRKSASGQRESAGFHLPRPMIASGNHDFSFSGLKTAVLYLLKGLGEIGEETKAEIAREFEDAITDTLVAKTRDALEQRGVKTLIVGGGVIANKHLREAFRALEQDQEVMVLIPETRVTTDNALMIAIAAYIKALNDKSILAVLPGGAEIEATGNLNF